LIKNWQWLKLYYLSTSSISFFLFLVSKWWATENRFAKMQWSEKQMEKIKQVREMFEK
jgi:hypothetical protein